MGFTTGFTSGVTLTLGLAYLTVRAHERNRQNQALYVRSQTQLLTSLVDPSPLPSPPSRAEIARTSRATFVESAKDRWNKEIENGVRWVQRTDWHGVRDDLEDSIARLWGGGLERSREIVQDAEEKAGPKLQEVVDKSLEKAGMVKDSLDEATAAAITSMDRRVEKGREIVDRVRTEGPGTVDAARGAVRDVISKGIEKGKEAIGAAQAAVGLSGGKAGASGAEIMSGLTEVDKALQQRYQTPSWLDKTADEAMEERYTPIDQRDNTVLRGV